MPSEIPPPAAPSASRLGLPMGLIGTIALIVAVESFVMKHDYDLTTLIASNWQIEGRAPARHAASNEVLIFGDSMVKFGVQPRVLKARLGKPAYNFALYCGSAPSSYFMLRRAFDAGAKPSAVVVDFQPELLLCDSMTVLSRVYPELLTFREAAELCWTARDADRLAEFAVAKVLPSARKRHEIRAGILAAFKGESASVRDKLLAARRNWKVNKGAEVLPKNPHFHGEVPEVGAYPAMFWVPWQGNPVNLAFLDRFLELAGSRQVPVFWILQPNAPKVDERREQVGYNAEFDRFIRSVQDRYPNLVVIDGRHVNYPHQVFIDPVHLDRQGATAQSLGVADVLQAHLADPKAAPRWVVLPDHRDRFDSIALEDNNESGIALKAEQEKTRR